MNRAFAIGQAVLLVLVSGAARADKPEAVVLKRQGDAHLARGAPDKAVAAYRKAIEVDPDYRGGYGALAAYHLRAHEFGKAVTVLQQLVGRFPSSPEGWYNLAYALRKQGNLDAAIVAYQRFAQLRPQSPDPHYGIALALRAKGDLAGAARSFRTYAKLEQNPGKKAWVAKALKLAERLEREAGVKPQLSAPSKPIAKRPAPPPSKPIAKRPPPPPSKPIAKSPPPPPGRDDTLPPAGTADDDAGQQVTPQRERAMAYKRQGDQLARQGRVAQAVERYKHAVKVDYTYTAAYNEMGTALFGLKRYNEAIGIFRIAIRDNPDYHLGWYNLAYALRKAGKLLPAIAAYDKFVKARPNDPDPYFGLALAHRDAGNTQQAVAAFRRYIQLERRQKQEQWVHRAKVELAKLEGKPPPKYVPGAVLAAPKAPEAKPLSAKERRRLAREERVRKAAEKRRLAAEARKAKLEAARLAREERVRKAAEKRRLAAEARKAKLEAARLAKQAKTSQPPAPAAKPAAAPQPPALANAEPAPDVIVSPPMPAAPGAPPGSPGGRSRVQGDTLARAGKLQQAARAYQQAIVLDPFDTVAYDGLAYCAFKLGAYRQGARRLSVGIRDNPDYARGWLHQARLYRAASDNVKAVGSYRGYLQREAKDVGVQLELARTLRALGMAQQAAEVYQRCLRPEKLQGNEPVVVAARAELQALGITATVAPATPSPTAKAKTPAQLRAEARVAKLEAAREKRRLAAEARKARREAERLARKEKRRQLLEKRRQAAAARVAKLEAARLAREERKRKAKEARLARLAARRGGRDRHAEDRAEDARIAALERARRRGKLAPGTDLAESVGQDVGEGTTVAPRARAHDALQPAPDAALGLVRVADEQFAKKRYVVALGIYQQAARLDPSASEPLYRAGVAAVALGQMHLAADLFRRVLQVDPGNGTAKVNMQMAEAAARSSRPPAAYLTRAMAEAKASLAAGRYALAEQQLTRLLDRTISAELHLLRGEARLALSKPRQALADGGRALALDPGTVEAFRMMGDAHRQLGHRHRAIYYYRLYLSRASTDETAAPTRNQIERALSELSQGQ